MFDNGKKGNLLLDDGHEKNDSISIYGNKAQNRQSSFSEMVCCLRNSAGYKRNILKFRQSRSSMDEFRSGRNTEYGPHAHRHMDRTGERAGKGSGTSFYNEQESSLGKAKSINFLDNTIDASAPQLQYANFSRI